RGRETSRSLSLKTVDDLPVECPLQCPKCSIDMCLLPQFKKQTVIRTNERGELLINIHSVVKQLSSYSRYNGGWIRQVDSLDMTCTDGRSIVGSKCENQKTWNRPGLYIDCSIDGARQNQITYHTLFELTKDGNAKEISMIYDENDWAVELWDLIEAYINYNDSSRAQSGE
ncbi:hypothetical protein LCGC14_2786850, partial [marine sediment metagenome]